MIHLFEKLYPCSSHLNVINTYVNKRRLLYLRGENIVDSVSPTQRPHSILPSTMNRLHKRLLSRVKTLHKASTPPGYQNSFDAQTGFSRFLEIDVHPHDILCFRKFSHNFFSAYNIRHQNLWKNKKQKHIADTLYPSRNLILSLQCLSFVFLQAWKWYLTAVSIGYDSNRVVDTASTCFITVSDTNVTLCMSWNRLSSFSIQPISHSPHSVKKPSFYLKISS